MATITVTKIAGDKRYYPDIYRDLSVDEAVSFERFPGQITNMWSITDGIAASELTMTVTYTAAEIASGQLAPPQSVQAGDIAPVAATAVAGGLATMFHSYAAGLPAEVPVIAAGSFPFKCRVLEVSGHIATAGAGASTLSIYDQAAGAGQLIATIATDVLGNVVGVVNTTTVITPGALIGLFFLRTDANAVGDVTLTVRPEN